MLDRYAAARLLLIEKGFDQQRSRENFVARRIQQIGARHMRGANRFALAAAQAILDGIGNAADVGLLHDQRFMPEQAEARRIGAAQIALRHQFVLVEMTLAGRLAACSCENRRVSASVRYSSLVMPMPCSPEITPSRLRAMPMIFATARFAVCSIA